MDVICSVLKQHYAVNQEEEVLKKRIKECVEEYGAQIEKDVRLLSKTDKELLQIYEEINPQHFSYLIVFYSFLVIIVIEEELIIKFTLHSLDKFIEYKKDKLTNKISFFSIFFYQLYKRMY